MKIAIIGAGPSGLASAKAALAQGLTPEVFEQSDTLGGVWRSNGWAWPQMQVNISRHTGVFSDFPWEDGKPDFPTTLDMRDYLLSYAKHFNLEPHIKYGRRVIHVSQKNTGWCICYAENQNEYEEYYDAVIIASGRFGTPRIPKINGIADFTGETKHSSAYRGGEAFKGKTVMIVGNGPSGTKIAEEAAETADQVIHIVPRPRWLVPKHVPMGSPHQASTLPHDLVKTRFRQSGLSIAQFYDYYTRLCESQNTIPAWRMEAASRFGIVAVDSYLTKVNEKKILPIKDEIVKFKNSTVVFKSGREEKIDNIIFCTGYETDLSYFDKELLAKFQLEQSHYSLYKHTIHPDFPTLAFIAMSYKDLGAVFPTAELQGILACKYFLGLLPSSTPGDLRSAIRQSKPIGDGLQLADTLAETLNMLPNFKQIECFYPDWYKILWHGAAIPAQYRLAHGEPAAKQAREVIEKTEKYRQALLAPATSDVNPKNTYSSARLFADANTNVAAGTEKAKLAPSPVLSTW